MDALLIWKREEILILTLIWPPSPTSRRQVLIHWNFFSLVRGENEIFTKLLGKMFMKFGRPFSRIMLSKLISSERDIIEHPQSWAAKMILIKLSAVFSTDIIQKLEGVWSTGLPGFSYVNLSYLSISQRINQKKVTRCQPGVCFYCGQNQNYLSLYWHASREAAFQSRLICGQGISCLPRHQLPAFRNKTPRSFTLC